MTSAVDGSFGSDGLSAVLEELQSLDPQTLLFFGKNAIKDLIRIMFITQLSEY